MKDLDYQIIASLEAGENPDQISKRLDVPKATVVRIKIKYDKAVVDGTLDELIDVDQLVMHNALMLSKQAIPSLNAEIDELGTQVHEGITRLTKLDDSLIATALFANTRVRSMLATANSVGELEVLIAALSKLRDTFFNKNVTQVNIQNNLSNSGAAAYGDFLSDKPN